MVGNIGRVRSNLLSDSTRLTPTMHPMRQQGGLAITSCMHNVRRKSHIVLSQTVALMRDGGGSRFGLTRRILRTMLPHANGTLHVNVANIPKTNGDAFVRTFNGVLVRTNCGITMLTMSPADRIAGNDVLNSGAQVRALAGRPRTCVHPSPTNNALNNITHGDERAVLLYRTTKCSVVLIRAIKIKRDRIAIHSVMSFFVLVILAKTNSRLRNVGGNIVRLTSTVIIGGTSKSGLGQTLVTHDSCSQVLRCVHPTARG